MILVTYLRYATLDRHRMRQRMKSPNILSVASTERPRLVSLMRKQFGPPPFLTFVLVLGMPYDFGIDVWSIGCTLFELYTGRILFTGRSNNQMLRAIMECRGKFSHKILRKAQFAALHFDDLLNFRSVEKDRLSNKVVRAFIWPPHDLSPTKSAAGCYQNSEFHKANTRP